MGGCQSGGYSYYSLLTYFCCNSCHASIASYKAASQILPPYHKLYAAEMQLIAFFIFRSSHIFYNASPLADYVFERNFNCGPEHVVIGNIEVSPQLHCKYNPNCMIFLCLFVCLPVRPSIRLSVCLFVCLSVFVCLCVYLYVSLYVSVYACLYICLCLYLSVYLYIAACICRVCICLYMPACICLPVCICLYICIYICI